MSNIVRVVSWNIRYGINIAGAIQMLTTTPQLACADIILLQEMDQTGTAQIAEALQFNCVYRRASVHRYHGNDFGNAILSRWPIEGARAVDLPHQAIVRGEPRVATRAMVHVGSRSIVAYSVHTEIPALRLAVRIAQFGEIAHDVNSLPTGPVIVGGDFNTVTKRGARALTASMSAARLTAVSPARDASFRRFGVPMNMDHVFARDLHPLRSGVGPRSMASDHRPIWVDYEREPSRTHTPDI